jgi:hypothetical protein
MVLGGEVWIMEVMSNNISPFVLDDNNSCFL